MSPHPSLPPRFERLECQLNDLTELHQHETSNLKQELASIEEKVAYQAYERARDIQVPPRSWPGLSPFNRFQFTIQRSIKLLPAPPKHNVFF